MMTKKKNLKRNIAAGAVLVALSGFVPKISKPANAATATIKASGSFTSGLNLTAGANLQFGKIVATGPSGSAKITTAGATAVSKAFFNGGVQKEGSFAFLAGALKVVDLTVVGMKNSLTLGSVAGVKTGVVNLESITLGGPLKTAQVFKVATTKQTNTLVSLTADINVGGVVTWGGIAPIGTFSQNVVLTVTF